MFDTVLIAIDGSQYTHNILSMAKSFCQPHTQVHIIYVGKTILDIELIDNRSVTAENNINQAIQEALDYLKIHDIKAKIHIASGDPAEQIVQYAGKIEARLIVMGHRQMTKISRLFDPSTCLKVIENAPCPLLIENLNKH